MLRNVPTAEELGLIRLPKGSVLPLDELFNKPAEQTAIICTGSQGEPFAALSLMAVGEHRSVTIEEGDTVLISAKPIPGNETKVSRVINGLLRRGARVYHGNNARVHVSGHAAADELKTFINVVRPQALVPVHGEYRHLRAHASLAEDMGVPTVDLCEDGDVVVLDGDKTRVERGALPSGYVYVDGLEVAGSQGIIRDRRHLSEDGVIVVTLIVDPRSGEIVRGPDLESHGFMDDPTDVFERCARSIRDSVASIEHPVDLEQVQRKVISTVNRITKAEAGGRAVVIPVVLGI
jgi:ribonuclease J